MQLNRNRSRQICIPIRQLLRLSYIYILLSNRGGQGSSLQVHAEPCNKDNMEEDVCI